MNIFYLDESPKTCAMLHCDKHVVKMVIEYAQLLSTAHRILDGVEWHDTGKKGQRVKRWRLDHHDDVIYKACHVNHPSAIWARQCYANYNWLRELWHNLCGEYTYRYGRVHATEDKLKHILVIPPKNMKVLPFTEPPPAMKQFPQCIVPGDSVQSYKNYYVEAKIDFAKWSHRKTPEFMKHV